MAYGVTGETRETFGAVKFIFPPEISIRERHMPSVRPWGVASSALPGRCFWSRGFDVHACPFDGHESGSALAHVAHRHAGSGLDSGYGPLVPNRLRPNRMSPCFFFLTDARDICPGLRQLSLLASLPANSKLSRHPVHIMRAIQQKLSTCSRS